MERPIIERHPKVILEPRSVKVPTAATALGISQSSCWAEVWSGRLRSFKYGSSVLVPVAALDAWVAAQETQDRAALERRAEGRN